MKNVEHAGYVGLFFGFMVGIIFLALLLTTTQEEHPCHEDEAIVWVEDGHDACVALDDMWWDPVSETVHWYDSDERKIDS